MNFGWQVLLQGGAQGLGIGAMLVCVRLLFGRLEKKEAHLDGATKHLIDELRAELNRLKDRCEACERKHDEAQAELARTHAELLEVKALLQAKGAISNAIQAGVAAERLLGKSKERDDD